MGKHQGVLGKHQGASGSSEKEKSFNGNGGEPNSVQAVGRLEKLFRVVATNASVEEIVRTATRSWKAVQNAINRSGFLPFESIE